MRYRDNNLIALLGILGGAAALLLIYRIRRDAEERRLRRTDAIEKLKISGEHFFGGAPGKGHKRPRRSPAKRTRRAQ